MHSQSLKRTLREREGPRREWEEKEREKTGGLRLEREKEVPASVESPKTFFNT